MPPPTPMGQHERMQLRAAAYRASKVLPEALAELVSRELLAWEEFGYRFGQSSVIHRAVKEIMNAPLLTER